MTLLWLDERNYRSGELFCWPRHFLFLVGYCSLRRRALLVSDGEWRTLSLGGPITTAA